VDGQESAVGRDLDAAPGPEMGDGLVESRSSVAAAQLSDRRRTSLPQGVKSGDGDAAHGLGHPGTEILEVEQVRHHATKSEFFAGVEPNGPYGLLPRVVTLTERPRAKGPPMRIRLAALLTAAIVLLPVATASANPSSSPQPAKKCPESMTFIFDHCD
jgi:hypothetical protein